MGNSSMGDRSSHGKRGLAPQWFLDSACFDFEKQKLFQRYWVPFGYQSSLRGPGSFFRFQFGKTECVAVLDSANQIRVYQNVCRHRGTQLCREPSGKLNSAFACPYHGWKYDFEGHLIAAPNMQCVEGFDAADFGLKEYPVETWNGLLFTATQQLASLPVKKLSAIAGMYELHRFKLVESITYDVQANWKLLFQNFNECYHCPAVHPQLTPYSDYRNSQNEFESGDVLGGPMLIRESAQTISNDGFLSGPIAAALPESERKKARYYTIFPNLFISFFPDYVMIHRIEPLTHSRTQITCDFLFHPETSDTSQNNHSQSGTPQFDSKKVTEFWDLTNRQDWEMCERVQIGLATPGFSPSPYSNLESLLVAFEEHYLEQMQGFAF